jgi:flagellar biosynthesis/type III secretory pathway M-ring protein FliF/YscJ
MSQAGAVVLGASISAVVILLAKLLELALDSRREKARWEREERSKLNLERRELYAKFLALSLNCQKDSLNKTLHQELNELEERIRFLATKSPREAATELARVHYHRFTSSEETIGTDLHAARENFYAAVRRELGVE